MIKKLAYSCLCFAVLAVTTPVLAGVNANAKAAVHVLPHASRFCSKDFPTITGCYDIQYTESSMDADCFPVFFDLAEYQSLDYGMTWPGLYSCAFTSCSPLTWGVIVNPGDGISHAWYYCQNSAIATHGWAWIYDAGQVCIVPHPTLGRILVGDCGAPAVKDSVRWFNIRCAGIGGVVGQDPCAPLAVEQTTWGQVKILFR